MERELMPDYTAERCYQRLIPPDFFETSERPKKDANQCVVFCKKVAPNVFDVQRGIAVVGGARTCFNDGACMISPETKVVFVFE